MASPKIQVRGQEVTFELDANSNPKLFSEYLTKRVLTSVGSDGKKKLIYRGDLALHQPQTVAELKDRALVTAYGKLLS